MLYLQDQIDPLLLEEISDKLQAISSKGIVSEMQVEELLSSSSFTLMPEYQYTGRPDYVVNALVRGRFMSRQGVPLPAALEVLLMVVLFELVNYPPPTLTLRGGGF